MEQRKECWNQLLVCALKEPLSQVQDKLKESLLHHRSEWVYPKGPPSFTMLVLNWVGLQFPRHCHRSKKGIEKSLRVDWHSLKIEKSALSSPSPSQLWRVLSHHRSKGDLLWKFSSPFTLQSSASDFWNRCLPSLLPTVPLSEQLCLNRCLARILWTTVLDMDPFVGGRGGGK